MPLWYLLVPGAPRRLGVACPLLTASCGKAEAEVSLALVYLYDDQAARENTLVVI